MKKSFFNEACGLAEAGAGGVALACTELPLLVKQEDVRVPLFYTTTIHAAACPCRFL